MQKNQDKELAEKAAGQELEVLLPYEQQRRNNIARNQRMLSQLQLGAQPAAQGFWQPLSRVAAEPVMPAGETASQPGEPEQGGSGQARQDVVAASVHETSPSKAAEAAQKEPATPMEGLQLSPAALEGSNAAPEAPQQVSAIPMMGLPQGNWQPPVEVSRPADDARRRAAATVVTEAAAAQPQHALMAPERKAQLPRACKKARGADAAEATPAHMKDATAVHSRSAADHGGTPGNEPSANEHRAANDHVPCKSKGKRPKRARAETSHQPDAP